MNLKFLALLIILSTNFRICQSRKYDRFSLINTVPTEPDQLRFLQNLNNQKYIDLTFWKEPSKLYEDVQLIVNPEDIELFVERAHHYKLSYKVTLRNLQLAFDSQTIKSYHRLRADSYSWDGYHTLEDIYQWLADITLKYSKFLELRSIGKSSEGRDIFVLIFKMSTGSKAKNVIVEGGIHGHEWIGIEYVIFLANALLHANETDNSRLKEIAQKYNWYFIPIVNPDGFAYSQTEDRLWKKNRRRIGKEYGVNLNRNFPYSFGSFGSSRDPKDENFCGPSALSEPETAALSRFINKKKHNLKFYFAYHAYGQNILIPFGDRVNHLGNYGEMENYAKQAMWQMYYQYGVQYRVGTNYDTQGFAPLDLRPSHRLTGFKKGGGYQFDWSRISGNSASWVKKNHKVKYVFTFLLRDNGTYGHALPATQVKPACDEAVMGMLEVMVAKPKHTQWFNQASIVKRSHLLVFLMVFVLK